MASQYATKQYGILVDPKPWGFEAIWAMVPGRYTAKRLHVDAGKRLSLQYHEFKDETMMLESGDAYLIIGTNLESLQRFDLVVGEPIHIPPGTIHRLCADTDTVVYEASSGEQGDVVRLDDDYNR